MDGIDGQRSTGPQFDAPAARSTSPSQPSEASIPSHLPPLISEAGQVCGGARPPVAPPRRAASGPVPLASAPPPAAADDDASPDAVHRLGLAGPGPPPKRQACGPRAEPEGDSAAARARDEFFDEFRKLRMSFQDRDEINALPSPGSSADSVVSFDAEDAAAIWLSCPTPAIGDDARADRVTPENSDDGRSSFSSSAALRFP